VVEWANEKRNGKHPRESTIQEAGPASP